MSWRETEENLDCERSIAELAKTKWNCTLEKTELGCPYDFKAIRDFTLRALIEVRRRNVSSTTYSEIFMGKAKWTKLLQLGMAYEVPVIFVVQFDDGVRIIDLTEHPRLKSTYASRGANPHGGERATDNEESVLIPVERMIEG